MTTGYDPTTDPLDAVRFHVGDTTAPFLLSDTEIQFALDQTSNPYGAAAICARALSARFSREVDARFETVWSFDSQKAEAFAKLARTLEQQAKKAGGLGLPIAGGISVSDVESVGSNTDRVRPYFRDGQFHNPPAPKAAGTSLDE